MNLSRRHFLRTLAVASAGSLLAACGGASAPTSPPPASQVSAASNTAPSTAAESKPAAAASVQPASAGAGASASPAASPASAKPSSGRPLRKFRYGHYSGSATRANDLSLTLPQLKGWYQELGIDYERVALSTTPVQFAALDADKVEGISDTSNPVFLRPKGIDVVVVFNDENSQTQYGMARPNLDIHNPNAWAGAKVRVSGLGENTTHIFMAKMIQDVGGDPRKAQFTAAPSGSSYKDETNALSAGTFDATSMFEPAVSYGLRHGLQKIGYLPDDLPYPGSGVVVSSKKLQSDAAYRDLLKDFFRGQIRAKVYMREPAHRAEMLQIMRDWSGNPPDLEPADYEKALDERLKVMTPYGKLQDPQVYRRLFKVAFDLGILNPKNYPNDYASYDFSKMLDYSLIDQAMAEEGIKA